MTGFVPDTNVWIGVGRDTELTSRLERVAAAGDRFLIAPPALIELVRGLVRHGAQTFDDDKKTYLWMKEHHCEVLELPKPFMAKVLKTTLPKNSGVIPKNYEELIGMIVDSANLDELVGRCAASVWNNIGSLDRIHEIQIDRELEWLMKLSSRNMDLAEGYSRLFGVPGCRPNPLIMRGRFSAFFEYLEVAFRSVRQGAKPWKNDRGMYVDLQLLIYLASPDMSFLTNENFAGQITRSTQRTRIVKPDTLV
jgi:hypothetical protein